MATKRELTLDLLARDKTAQATRSAAKNIDHVGDAAEDAAKSTEKLGAAGVVAGHGVDEMGDEAREAARDIEKLNRDIALTEAELRSLARSFARTGDAAERLDISKAIRRGEADIRRLNKSKGLLSALLPSPAEAASAAAKVGATMGTEIGSSAAQSLKLAGRALGPVLAGVVAASLPIVAATVSAAIIGGAGIGGVVGGVMLAARDPRVTEAGTTLGQILLADLESRARVFVDPVLDAIDEIHAGFAGMGADLDRIFQNTSKFVAPLTRGLLVFVQQVTGGIADLTDAAGPVIEVLSTGVARLGDAIGDVFTDLSDNGVDAAVALNSVFQLLEGTIRAVGVVVNGLTESFGFLAKVGAFGRDAQLEYIRLEANAKLAAAANEDVASSLGAVKAVGGAAATAIGKVADAVGDLNEENRTLYGSTTDVAQALADTTKAIKENGTTLDLNTQKGRDNRTALENLATTLASNLEAYRSVNGEGPRTDAVAEANRQSFIKLATQLTGSKQKAIELANKLLGIPSVTPKVRVDTGSSESRIQAIKDSLKRLPGTKTITIRTRSEIPAGLAQGFLMREHGGPVKAGHAYVVGEKRPEIFVPDRDGKVIPDVDKFTGMGGGSGGGGGTVNVVVSAAAGASRELVDILIEQLRFRVDRNGNGSAQNYLGRAGVA